MPTVTGEVHRPQARFSPVNFTEYPRFLMPANTIFSLVASSRLHSIDPEQYLDEVMRALPDWPKDRYLELSPKYWKGTRGNLLTADLESPLCAFTVPPAALNFAR